MSPAPRRLSEEEFRIIMGFCREAGLNGRGKMEVLFTARLCNDENGWIDHLVQLRDGNWKNDDGTPGDPMVYRNRYKGGRKP